MTSVEHWRSTPDSGESHAHISYVRIAGVPWPAYKLIALAVGFAVLTVVGTVTTSATPAVLGGAAVGAVVWILLGFTNHSRN